MFGSSPDPVPEEWEPPAGGPIAEPTVPRLIALLGLRTCWFESFPFAVQLPRIEPGRIVLPADEPGVASWSGEIAVELPIRHRGLTLGRFVLVPASPTTGVGLSVTARAEAIAIAASVGTRLAESIVAERDDAPSASKRDARAAHRADRPDRRPSARGRQERN